MGKLLSQMCAELKRQLSAHYFVSCCGPCLFGSLKHKMFIMKSESGLFSVDFQIDFISIGPYY